MRKVLLAILILFINIQANLAANFEVVVLPTSICKITDNYYSFDNVDEIFAKDITKQFNSSHKIHAFSIDELQAKIYTDAATKSKVCSAINQYNKLGTINYQNFKSLAKSFNARSILLISATSETFDGEIKKDVWESLNISSAFDIKQMNNMKIDAVLLDNVNDLVMYSAVYNFPLADKNGSFQAMNYAQATEHLEKIKHFSKEILSKSIAQNVTLRFFPKSIRPIEVKSTGDSVDSGLLKYNKNIPSMHKFGKKRQEKQRDEFKEDEFGEMIYGL